MRKYTVEWFAQYADTEKRKPWMSGKTETTQFILLKRVLLNKSYATPRARFGKTT